MTDSAITEPTAEARQIAFKILTQHPDCLRDDVVMNDLIDDIATAIEGTTKAGRLAAAIKCQSCGAPLSRDCPSCQKAWES